MHISRVSFSERVCDKRRATAWRANKDEKANYVGPSKRDELVISHTHPVSVSSFFMRVSVPDINCFTSAVIISAPVCTIPNYSHSCRLLFVPA